jgi:hypothetical protein
VTTLVPEPSSIWRFADRLALGEARLSLSATCESAEPMHAVFVFMRETAGWTFQARLVASDSVPDASFGISVAVEGARAVVGAYSAPSECCGAAYVFTESCGSWTEEARLAVTDFGPAIWFGLAVAVEGDTIAVGAPRVCNPGGGRGEGLRVLTNRRRLGATGKAEGTPSVGTRGLRREAGASRWAAGNWRRF